MAGTPESKPSLIGRVFPEQRFFLKSGDSHTRYIKLGSKAQAAMAFGGLVICGWLTVATSVLVYGWLSADSAARQTQALRAAYESRITSLAEERDTRNREAAVVHQRFQMALGQISQSQADLMQLQEERRELSAALAEMRSKLATTVSDRDDARANASDLSSELNTLESKYATNLGTESELTDTLTTITAALSQTVEARDGSRQTVDDLAETIANMEFRERVNADRQDRIFSQLEDAVLITLDPLETLLRTSGKDVDALLDQVRRQYNGEGGPLIPAAMPGGQDQDPIYNRFRLLMEKFDRAHLMQLAAAQIPLAMPVKRTVRFTSGFGRRTDPITKRARQHKGQDLAGPRGTPILSTADGVVSFAGKQSGYGNVVKIRHGFGFETVYAHLNKITVTRGEKVSKGDVIGGMGNTGRSTGTHLHYEIRVDGTPVNPMQYMKAARNVF